MAVPSNTYQAHGAIGNREDLTNVITLLTPYDTPFQSLIGREKARGTFHEWQTQALADAASNAVVEGDDPSNDTVTATVRVGNYVQLLDKVVQVSSTQQWVDKAGRTDELSEQIRLKALELKRDVEFMLMQTGARAAGSSSRARNSAGIRAWIATNTSSGTGGANPTGDGTDTRTNGTQRPFTETMVLDVLQLIAVQGGYPDCLMAGAFNRRQISAMSGGATAYRMVDDKKLISTVKVWESDWGDLKIIFNRHQFAREVFALQSDTWRMATGDPYKIEALAKAGHSDKRMLSIETCLVALAQQHNGIVADLTTS